MAGGARSSAGNKQSSRMAAASKTKERANERSSSKGNKKWLQCPYPPLEKEAGKVTNITVLAYKVKEGKRHPEHGEDGFPHKGMWFRRTYGLHRNLGSDGKIDALCPRSFNPKAECQPCVDVEDWRKDYKANKDNISTYRPRDWELYLVYSHDTKDIRVINESYGAFGEFLDARLRNPMAEDWNGFWVPNNEGYALRVTWSNKKIGEGDWVIANGIDFMEPDPKWLVPKEVWAEIKDIDLADLFRVPSSERIAALYQGDEDDEEEDETQATSSSGPDDEVGQEDTGDTLDDMDLDGLLAFAREKDLKDEKGKVICRLYARSPLEKVREVIRAALEVQNDDIPSEGTCPKGYEFGADFNAHESDCKKCADDTYEACMNAYQASTD